MVAVLDAQNDIGAGAAAGALLQEAATPQGRRYSGQGLLAHPPCLTVAVNVALARAGGSVPDHLLWPGVVCQNVLSIKRVDGHVILHPAIFEDVIPAVK